MPSTRNVLYSLLVTAALLLSGWSFFITYHKKAILPDTLDKPDAYMDDVIATIIDKQGNPSIKIVASKMIHYVENDATDITNPLMTLYRKSPKPWHLSADHARTLQGISQILLWENVIINHPGDDQNEKTTLAMPTLTVYPENQTASTADPVVINQPNSKIHAIGMNADLASGTVKLLSQARGEFSVQE